MTEVKVPKLGVSMEEGAISEWMVEDGATVKEGDVLYLLETEKIETEVESPASGVIRLIGEIGETYLVGDLIAEIS